MKPFNLEAAKRGDPLITRLGFEARIICFDARRKEPIIALINYDGNNEGCTEHYDLEGVNIIYYEFDEPTHKNLFMKEDGDEYKKVEL